MAQIATTIEQSKKLIELGLSADTADMYYPLPCDESDLPQVGVCGFGCTPAWSLSALIELMPIKIRNSKQFTIYKGESGYSLTYFFHDEDYPIIKDGVTILDTAFEMVCYLLENKLIK